MRKIDFVSQHYSLNQLLFIVLVFSITYVNAQFDSTHFNKTIFDKSALIIKAKINHSEPCDFNNDPIPMSTCFNGKIIEVLKMNQNVILSKDSSIKIIVAGSWQYTYSHHVGGIGGAGIGIGYLFLIIDSTLSNQQFRPFTDSFIYIPKYNDRIIEFNLDETHNYPYASSRFQHFAKREDLEKYLHKGLAD